jgi:hypothetical protein
MEHFFPGNMEEMIICDEIKDWPRRAHESIIKENSGIGPDRLKRTI